LRQQPAEGRAPGKDPNLHDVDVAAPRLAGTIRARSCFGSSRIERRWNRREGTPDPAARCRARRPCQRVSRQDPEPHERVRLKHAGRREEGQLVKAVKNSEGGATAGVEARNEESGATGDEQRFVTSSSVRWSPPESVVGGAVFRSRPPHHAPRGSQRAGTGREDDRSSAAPGRGRVLFGYRPRWTPARSTPSCPLRRAAEGRMGGESPQWPSGERGIGPTPAGVVLTDRRDGRTNGSQPFVARSMAVRTSGIAAGESCLSGRSDARRGHPYGDRFVGCRAVAA
jgi:hypothetical protein